jgi:hypothetical protein
MAKDSSKVWAVMSLVAGIGAATVTRKVLDTSWKAASGRKPPQNPADPDVGIAEAVVWASLTGAAVALARMLAQRRAADYYTRSTGHLPPELKKDEQKA